MIYLNDSLDTTPVPSFYTDLIATQEDRDLICEAMSIGDFDRLFHEGEASTAINEAMSFRYADINKKVKQLAKAIKKNLTPNGIETGNHLVSKVVKGRMYATVSVQIPFSDGQSVTAIFHSPSGDVRKIEPQDMVTTFKWMINSRNITDHLISARGKDYSNPQMGKILADLVLKNHDKFVKAKAKTEEEAAELEALNKQIESDNKENDLLNESIKELDARIQFLQEENAELRAKISQKRQSNINRVCLMRKLNRS